MSNDVPTTPPPHDERALLTIAYQEIAILAVRCLAPPGNPHRIDEDFISAIREERRTQWNVTSASRVDPDAKFPRLFEKCAREVVRTALTRGGYDDAFIGEVIGRALGSGGD